MSEAILVFGSNLAGRHGAGAAYYAMTMRGAEYGVGEGRTGNAYALPTKDERIETRPIADVAVSVEKFLDHARANPGERFSVTPVGCGLAGFTRAEIAPLFDGAPANCVFAERFRLAAPCAVYRYWGAI